MAKAKPTTPKKSIQRRTSRALPKDCQTELLEKDFNIILKGKLYFKLYDFAKSRGTTIQTLISVATTALMKQSKHYDLDTLVAFGKYSGQSMESIIRLDPDYIVWATGSISGLTLSGPAVALLENMCLNEAPPEGISHE